MTWELFCNIWDYVILPIGIISVLIIYISLFIYMEFFRGTNKKRRCGKV